MRVLSSLILLLLGAACAQWEEEPTIVIEATPLAPEAARAESVAALESGHDGIRVRRMISLPDACQSLTADLTRIERDLMLWVTTVPVREGCAPEEAYVAYTAQIEGLRPGRYNLRVIHARDGRWRGTEAVLEHPVVVLERAVHLPES